MKNEAQHHLSVNHFLGLIVFLNLVLVISSIVSYASVINSINLTEQAGSIDFGFLTVITALLALNMFAIAAGSVWNFQEDYTTTRRFGVLNAFIACVALVSYGGIMTILAKESDPIVHYQFPTQIMTYRGLNLFDPTPWLLFALLASTLIMILRQTIGFSIKISLGKHGDH
jgi:hypothetical protein